MWYMLSLLLITYHSIGSEYIQIRDFSFHIKIINQIIIFPEVIRENPPSQRFNPTRTDGVNLTPKQV